MAISLSKQTRNAASVNISAKYGLPDTAGRNVYCVYKGAFYISTKQDAINADTDWIFDWYQQTDNLATDFNPSTIFLRIVQSSTDTDGTNTPFQYTKVSDITLSASFYQTDSAYLSFDESSVFDEASTYAAAVDIDWSSSLFWDVNNKVFRLKFIKPGQGGVYQIFKGIYYFF